MKILFIDSCARKESRTRKLAEALLEKFDGNVEILRLYEEDLPTLDAAALNKRDADVKAGNYEDPVYRFARSFAEADKIVIAAPFWDCSFPAILKKYIETISVVGITFRYSAEGIPIGLCRADELYYVTTAGGEIFQDVYGYGYIEAMANSLYGIPCCHYFKAENLDIQGADVDEIMKRAEMEIREFQMGKEGR